MRRIIVVWTAILLLSVTGRAQEKLPASQSLNSGSTEMSPNPMLTEDQRIKALEDQVQLLTQQLSLLRGELTFLREANTAAPEFGPRVVLTSVHIPGRQSCLRPLLQRIQTWPTSLRRKIQCNRPRFKLMEVRRATRSSSIPISA